MKNSKNSRFHCNCCTITIACNLSTTLQQWKSWRFAHGALHLKTLLEKRSVGRCSLCNVPRVISFNLHVRHIVFRYSPLLLVFESLQFGSNHGSKRSIEKQVQRSKSCAFGVVLLYQQLIIILMSHNCLQQKKKSLVGKV